MFVVLPQNTGLETTLDNIMYYQCIKYSSIAKVNKSTTSTVGVPIIHAIFRRTGYARGEYLRFCGARDRQRVPQGSFSHGPRLAQRTRCGVSCRAVSRHLHPGFLKPTLAFGLEILPDKAASALPPVWMWGGVFNGSLGHWPVALQLRFTVIFLRIN
jgi:hypothetical protein